MTKLIASLGVLALIAGFTFSSAPQAAQAGPRCGRGHHWVQGHQNRGGHWVPGHCAPNKWH